MAGLFLSAQRTYTSLPAVVLALVLAGCTDDDAMHEDNDSAVVFTQGDPLVIEENPSEGIVGQLSGSDSSGGNSAGGDTSGGDSAGGDSAGGDSAGGDSAGGDSAGGDSAGGDSAGGDTSGGSVPGAVPLEPQSNSSLSVSEPVNSIEFDGVEIDQVFDPALNTYTGSAGYLVTAAEVSINGGEPVSVDLTAQTNTVEISSSAGGLTYTFDIARDPVESFMQQAYLKDSQGRQNGEFGSAVAIDGDTAAVLGRSAERRVSVFRRDGGVWTLESVLTTTGNSLAIAGDYLAVGDTTAPGRDIEGFGVGSVKIFKRSSSGWEFSRTLVASYPDEGDQFGYAVSLDGAVLAVGAPRENSNATGINGNADDDSALDAGAVYVFVRDQYDDWVKQAYLKGAATDGGDKFGISVDLERDQLAVGAIGEESGANTVNGNQQDESLFGSGAVYVFKHSDGQWSQEAYVKPVAPGSSDLFGSSVAISGQTLAVGAVSEDSSATGINGDPYNNSASNSGAVYVFEHSGSGWRQQAYIKAANTDDGDHFGSALALQGHTLVVGAPFEDSMSRTFNESAEDNSSNNAGAVYVFNRLGGVWQQMLYVHTANADSADHFSADGSLALDAGTLLVGAPGESSRSRLNDQESMDNSQPRAGAGYVFR